MRSLLIPEKLTKVCDVPEFTLNPTDYFDFWSSLKAFGKSLKTSDLVTYHGAYFRQRNKNLTLCTYTCSGEELKETLSELQAEGYKIKTLNFVHKNMEGLLLKPYGNEYYIHGESFTLDDALSRTDNSAKTNQTIRRGYRIAEEQYEIETAPPFGECTQVFWKWVEDAKKRHFMVVTGHYLKYLDMAYSPSSGIQVIGFRRKDTKELCGIAGWEYAWNNTAQITLMKHSEQGHGFPKYLWIKTIDTIMKRSPLQHPCLVFCGTTADELKKRIGLDYWKSYKIVIGKEDEKDDSE